MGIGKRLVGAMIVTAFACGGCSSGGAPREGESTAAEQAGLEVVHYRYGDERLTAKFDGVGEARVLLEGPDNTRIEELLGVPTSGIAADPTDKTTYWVYTNDQERDAVIAQLRIQLESLPKQEAATHEAPTAPPSSTLSLFPPGSPPPVCPGPYAVLYVANNLASTSLTMGTGGLPDLNWYGINDQLSSLTAYKGVISLYENANYGGHSITLTPDLERWTSNGCSGSWLQVNALANYTMISRWYWSNTSWNDQTTSVWFSGN
jgi:hypothetical protein